MFTKILYPTDFSDVALKALGYIKQLREAGSQEIILVHVINRRILDGLQRHAVASEDIVRWKNQVRETAEASLAEMRADLEAVGFIVKTVVRTGYPWQVILNLEKEENPSIIVVGSHGRSNVSDMLLGSVSDRVSRKSRNPVLIVKRDPVQ